MLTTYSPASSANGYALGLRLPVRTAPRLKLRWCNGVPPAAPPAADHLKGWGYEMGANNRFGTCGPTSASNHLDMTMRFLADSEVNAPDEAIFDLYRRSGSPNFDPRTGRGDWGVTMDELGAALVAYGLAGRKAIAVAELDDHSDESVRAAIHTFGGVLMAVSLETAQQAQTDQGVWDYRASPDWGGHAILAGAYDAPAGRVDVVTWAKRVSTTAAFRRMQLSSYQIVLWPEIVASGRFFDSGVDVGQLAADYTALTGQPWPAPLPPPPPPPPPPQPADGLITIDPARRTYSFPAGWSASGGGGLRRGPNPKG